MKKVIWNGAEESVQLSIGGRSIVASKGVPVEIPDDWKERALSNPGISEAPTVGAAVSEVVEEITTEKKKLK
jgi:hypothetical protein